MQNKNYNTILETDRKIILALSDKQDRERLKNVYDNLIYHDKEVSYVIYEGDIRRFQDVKCLNIEEIEDLSKYTDFVWIFFDDVLRDKVTSKIEISYYIDNKSYKRMDSLRNYSDSNGNEIKCDECISESNIIFYGNNNKIYIEGDCKIGKNVRIELHNDSIFLMKESTLEDDCKIIIYDNSIVKLNGTRMCLGSEISSRYFCNVSVDEYSMLSAESLVFAKYGSKIAIGRGCTFEKGNHIIVERGKILVGDDLMTSFYVDLICGDGHAVFDSNGIRRNDNKVISVGSHVWIGAKSTLLGGASVGNDVIIGANSVVNKVYQKNNVTIAGAPSKIVREGTNWERYLQ